MFIILSPAKNMQSSRLEGLTLSRPRFLAQTEQLVETLRKFSPWQQLIGIRLLPVVRPRCRRNCCVTRLPRPAIPQSRSAIVQSCGLCFRKRSSASTQRILWGSPTNRRDSSLSAGISLQTEIWRAKSLSILGGSVLSRPVFQRKDINCRIFQNGTALSNPARPVSYL